MSTKRKKLDHKEKAIRAIRFSVLGPLQSECDLGDLPRKARALLAYLVMKQGVMLSREALVGMFWRDRAEAQARASLRQALSLIRKALGDQSDLIFKADREGVTVNPQAIGLDLEEFLILSETKEVADLRKAVALIRGDLLEGLTIDVAPFDQWLVTEREAFRQKAVGSYSRLTTLLEDAGLLDDAITYKQKLLSLDPADEEAHRSLIRIYTAKGRTDMALDQFQRCCRELTDRLGVEPDSRTADLARRAKAMRDRVHSGETEPNKAASTENDFPNILLAWMDASGPSASIQAELQKHQGGVLKSQPDRGLAQFIDPAQALLAAVELSKMHDVGVPMGRPAPRVGVHLTERMDSTAPPGRSDIAIANQLCAAAKPGEAYVSQRFFEHARRTSPCTFEDVGTLDLAPGGLQISVLRVSGNISRHPFQASHVHERPVISPQENSVAVKPIRITSSGDDEGYLAEGLTEDIILELGRLPGLFVSSRTTAPTIEKRNVSDIGEALGVRFVLSGSLRRGGDNVTLNMRLTEAKDGRIVWSEKIIRPFAELFELVEEIAARVAGSVGARVEQEALSAARLKRPESMTAYDHYLRGVWHHRMGGVTSEHSRKAVEWFRRAIELEPTFSRPRAALVCAWSDLPDYDHDRAVTIVEEALQFDPTDPEVHRILGAANLHKGDFAAARHHTERATQMAPNDAYLLGRSASFFSFVGEPEIALEKLDRAEQLDPFLPVYAVEERLIAEYGLGHFDAVLLQARRLPFQSRRSRYYSAAALVALERLDDAKVTMREALTADHELSDAYVLGQEKYEDNAVLKKLLERLYCTGLPREA